MSEEKALKVVEVSPVLPVVSVGEALEAWETYQLLCRQLLDDNDYVTISGREHRKRSGWAKLRKFYGIDTNVLQEEWWKSEDDWGCDFLVIACQPGGRCEVADGSCSASELMAKNMEPTRHGVRSRALTRAKNRATSDLIGGGEISAEEVEGDNAPKPRKKARTKEPEGPLKLTPKGEALAWFKEQCQNAGISGETVFLKLGMPFDQYLTEMLEEVPALSPMDHAKEAFENIISTSK